MLFAAAQECRGTPGDQLADIGFGGGGSLALLLRTVSPGGHVYGVDTSKTMVDRARRVFRHHLRAASLTIRRGTADELPLATDSLDALMSVNTVYFLDDLVPPFREFARVLRGSGRAVVCLGDPIEMARLPLTSYGFTLRSLAEIESAMAEAGLTVTERRRFGDPPDTFHLLVARRS